MVIESAQRIFEVNVEELSTWEKRPHKHNFFELVYIEQGSGVQCINQHEFQYRAGNIFLLPPLDCHSFRIEVPTRFYFIRFTNHYFFQKEGAADYQAWFDRMAYVLANYNKVPGDIISTDRERQYIISSIHTIHQEHLTPDSFSEPIIMGAIAAILSILARGIERRYVDQASETDKRFGEILRYIHTNITHSDRLRIPVIADRFHLSYTYFSEYFKKQAGIPLLDYILRSKLRIAETKILHTDLSLKEIAYQLNFTDASHLAKAFKKTYGMTVSQFRNSGQACCK